MIYFPFLISSLFPPFLITSNSLRASVPLTLPLHLHFPTSLHCCLQRGHHMNYSEVLQDDNGKLEVRLCMACIHM